MDPRVSPAYTSGCRNVRRTQKWCRALQMASPIADVLLPQVVYRGAAPCGLPMGRETPRNVLATS
jgi:hypothetical protein